MDDLSNPELGLLKSLLSGRPLPTEAQTSIVDALRSKAPDFFSQFTSDLTEEKRKDNYSVFKHLTKNRDKIKIALNKAKYFSANQQTDLINALEKPVATEAVIYQQGQGPTEQTASGTATGGSGGGMPSMPSVSVPAVHPIFRTKPPVTETPKPDIAPLQKPDIPSGRKLNIPSVRNSFSTGFKNLQNFAAPANPFLKTNLNRIGQGFKSMFGNLGGAGLNALGRGLNLGGNAAGRLSNFKSSMGGRIKGVGNRGSSLVKGGGRKFALASGLGFLLFFLIAMSGNMTGTTPIGNAAPPAPVPAPPGPITPPIPPGPIPPPAPCTGGDYKACLALNYKLDFEAGFPDSFLQMAYQSLSSADTIAPKFKSLITSSCSRITVKVATGTSHVSGCTMNLKPTIGAVAFVHELGHVIRNSDLAFYENIITEARRLDSAEWDGFLTYYSKFSSAPDDFSTECYSYATASKDEEFAESITYFINYTAIEIPMGRGCSVKWGDNPYQNGNRYKGHYNLISGILK